MSIKKRNYYMGGKKHTVELKYDGYMYTVISDGVLFKQTPSKIYGTAEEIISQFDFSITKFAYYKAEIEDETGAEVEELPFDDGNKVETHIEYRVIYDDKFFEHLHLKRLVIDDKIPFPMSTFERMLRYAKYGYFPCRETKLKLIRALNELDSREIEVSESLYKGWD